MKLEPERLLDELEQLHGEAVSRANGAHVELYRRTSLRRRVTIESDGRIAVDEGRDEGTAIRLAGAASGFAAATGCHRRCIAWLVERALTGGGDPGSVRWARGTVRRVDDARGEAAVETAENLLEVLRAARPREEDATTAWIESAGTVEALVAEGGLAAVRSRRRVWAMSWARLRFGSGEQERPRLLAARGLEGLGRFCEEGSGSGEAAEVPRLPLVLAPSAAGVLVRALATALVTPGQGSEKLNTSMRIDDDPAHPRGLYGGRFDDAGFPTEPRALAAGGEWVDTASSPPVWRPSFRDPPRPRPSNLVVGPGSEGLPERHLWVTDLHLHGPDTGRWVLELDGIPTVVGESAGPWTARWLRAAPADLAKGLQALEAEARVCANGVITPPLLLAGRVTGR